MLTENEFNDIYSEIRIKIESIMAKKGVDFCNMSKIVHQIVKDFDKVIKNRYP